MIEMDLKKHVLYQNAAAVKEFCGCLSLLSIDGFIFMRRFSGGTFVDLSNQLEWSDNFLTRYLDGQIDLQHAQDHMCLEAGLSLWSQNPSNSIYQEGRARWGFHSGISIAKEGPNWTDLFCFYSRKEHLEMDTAYLKNFQLLEKFNLLFLDKFHAIIKQGEKNPLVTPAVYLQRENSSSNKDSFIKSLIKFPEPLSKRELECIYYIAKGNTASQVGKILHLSRRTVETHIQKAKDKLSVTKTSELIKFFPEW